MFRDFQCDYNMDEFLEILSSLDNEISNFIYIMNVFKKNIANEEEKILIESYIKVLSLVVEYNTLFEQVLYNNKEER